MPRGDGSGPQGMGPMTGRRLGYCADRNAQGVISPVERAYGRGYGGGRGHGLRRGRCGFNPQYAGLQPWAGVFPAAAPDEETVLKSHVSALEEQLAAVKTRLGEIKDAKTSDQ